MASPGGVLFRFKLFGFCGNSTDLSLGSSLKDNLCDTLRDLVVLLGKRQGPVGTLLWHPRHSWGPILCLEMFGLWVQGHPVSFRFQPWISGGIAGSGGSGG